MIHPIDIAQAAAEATEPDAAAFIVRHYGAPIQFVFNLCGYFGNTCMEENATRFASIHAAGAACRRARLTGEIAIEGV